MAYTMTIKQESAGTTIECVGADAQEVSQAVLAAVGFLNYKPEPVPTPDPPQ